MTIELWDMDVEYSVSTDINGEGKNFIRITPNSSSGKTPEAFTICLKKEHCDELIRVLNFASNELTIMDKQ